MKKKNEFYRKEPKMYYLSILGKDMGPFTLEELQELAKQGRLSEDTVVKIDGKTMKAGEVEGMRSAITSAAKNAHPFSDLGWSLFLNHCFLILNGHPISQDVNPAPIGCTNLLLLGLTVLYAKTGIPAVWYLFRSTQTKARVLCAAGLLFVWLISAICMLLLIQDVGLDGYQYYL